MNSADYYLALVLMCFAGTLVGYGVSNAEYAPGCFGFAIVIGLASILIALRGVGEYIKRN